MNQQEKQKMKREKYVTTTQYRATLLERFHIFKTKIENPSLLNPSSTHKIICDVFHELFPGQLFKSMKEIPEIVNTIQLGSLENNEKHEILHVLNKAMDDLKESTTKPRVLVILTEVLRFFLHFSSTLSQEEELKKQEKQKIMDDPYRICLIERYYLFKHKFDHPVLEKPSPTGVECWCAYEELFPDGNDELIDCTLTTSRIVNTIQLGPINEVKKTEILTLVITAIADLIVNTERYEDIHRNTRMRLRRLFMDGNFDEQQQHEVSGVKRQKIEPSFDDQKKSLLNVYIHKRINTDCNDDDEIESLNDSIVKIYACGSFQELKPFYLE